MKREIHATIAPGWACELGLKTEAGAPTKSEGVTVETDETYQRIPLKIVKGRTNPVIDGGSGWHPIVYTTPVWFPVPDHCSEQFSGWHWFWVRGDPQLQHRSQMLATSKEHPKLFDSVRKAHTFEASLSLVWKEGECDRCNDWVMTDLRRWLGK